MSLAGALVREARPKQWIKNGLVFAGPGAAGVLDNGEFLVRTLVMAAAFCAVSSGTYYWNDLLDVEADRRHPTKRHRPIAAGLVPLWLGRVVGTLLLVGGVALGAATGRWQSVAVLAAYVVLTTSYSRVLKHVAVVDLMAVAGGFVLRAVGGAVATRVAMSTWFVICIVFGSLFIVTGKRYAELRELGDGAIVTRPSMETYTVSYLRLVLSVACGSTMVAYCIWAFDTSELSGSTWPFYELSIVPVLTALLRYLLVLEAGHGGAPEEVFTRDRPLQLLGVAWAVVFALGVYVG
jgi:decaprenyl-phosphate phosphoribosyltransferase